MSGFWCVMVDVRLFNPYFESTMIERNEKRPEISVICCFRDSARWSFLREKIEDLSTTDIEVIGIDNSSNAFTLPEALNSGKQSARGVFLLFVHDDVLFVEQNWDGQLLSFLHDSEDAGVVGFAGGKVTFNAPVTWWSRVGENETIRNMIQRNRDGSDETIFDSSVVQEVVGLDGFAFAVRRELIEGFQWSNEIGSWHGYDLDLCYHSHFVLGKKNYVLPGPVFHHLSLGTINEDWGIAIIKIWVKYHRYLGRKGVTSQDYEALKLFVNWTHKYDISKELAQALRKFQFGLWSEVLVAMCYSRCMLTKKIGFKLLDKL